METFEKRRRKKTLPLWRFNSELISYLKKLMMMSLVCLADCLRVLQGVNEVN